MAINISNELPIISCLILITNTIYKTQELIMAGKAKQQIDLIIEAVSKGNATLKITTKTKLLLKGLDPDRYTNSSEDDPVVLDKIKTVAASFGVTIK